MKENIESTGNFYKYFKTRDKKKKINNLTRNKEEFEKLDMKIKEEKKEQKETNVTRYFMQKNINQQKTFKLSNDIKIDNKITVELGLF